MRLLLISDIHSNLEAFESCLDATPEHDHVANLGDIVGYGASPNEVTERARKLGGTTIRGNHDRACAGLVDLHEFNPIAGMAALWTKQVLTPENLSWLKALPPGPLAMPTQTPNGMDATWTGGGSVVQLVHGSPLGEDDYIIALSDAEGPLMKSKVAVTFFGHTHIQGGFVEKGKKWATLYPEYHSRLKRERFQFPLEPQGKYLINPGSIGQPRDGDMRAAFALFDSDKYAVTFYRVPYDVAAAQKRIIAARLPERLATRLAEGR